MFSSPDQDIAMVDVGAKQATRRTARARGHILLGEKAFVHLKEGTLDKGNGIAAARIAGILAAKRTPELIPLCHPLPLDRIAVDIACIDAKRAVRVEAEVSAHAKTGVEMEALHAVCAALLTLYDMCKPYGQDIAMQEIFLVSKTGGKSGDYENRRVDDLG